MSVTKENKRDPREEILCEMLINIRVNVYQYIHEKNITLADLAVKAKVNYSAMWKLLNKPIDKATAPTLRTLLYLADALNVDVSYLINNHDQK